MILGIDEVGRGPWAGPLVVGAVVLGGADIEGLTDSKKLSKKRREALDIEIRDKASGIGLGWVSAQEIDQIGLSEALVVATTRAVEQISVPYHEIIIDGTINFLKNTSKGQYVLTMKKADLLVPAVSAASIVAKVARDRYMYEQDVVYPSYGFAHHVGYGTALHIAAIKVHGVTPLHRLSIAPLAKYAKRDNIANRQHTRGISIATRTTKFTGDEAEEAASRYLVLRGHKILERNWKTKFCEIDIVSTKGNVLFFNEVKYRQSAEQGGGIAAITPKKLKQMKFAVNLYVHTKHIVDFELRLTAVAVSGVPPEITQYLEIV
jgi:ribonuclease HII